MSRSKHNLLEFASINSITNPNSFGLHRLPPEMTQTGRQMVTGSLKDGRMLQRIFGNLIGEIVHLTKRMGSSAGMTRLGRSFHRDRRLVQ